MSLRLSVNRAGFDMNAGDLRDAITDLTTAAADLGGAISALGVDPRHRDMNQRLRAHRTWLMAQAVLLREKLALHEERARNSVIRQTVAAQSVTLRAPVERQAGT
jgi:hypothetical protein